METKKAVFLFTLFFLCASAFAQVSPPKDEPPAAAAVEEAPPDPETIFVLVQNRKKGITITGYKGTEKDVVIPETIKGLPVTVIGNKAFFRKELASVVIPQSVQAIEPLAFAENYLESVEIAGCVSIGYEAFAGNNLSRVVLSEQLASIGPRGFYDNKLSSINLSATVTNIGKDAFAKNPLASITVAQNRNLFTSQGFELSFVNYYISLGRRAGVYNKNGKVWIIKE
jgi:hypothetical protein